MRCAAAFSSTLPPRSSVSATGAAVDELIQKARNPQASAFRLARPATLLICLARDGAVFEEGREFPESERLAGIDERLARLGVDVGEDEVRPGDHTLRRGMEYVLQAVGRNSPHAHRVRRIDANRHACKALDHRHLREIDQVAVRIAEVRLHAAQAEDDVAVARGGDVLGGEQRFVQRDPEATLEQDGEVALAADGLQELEVLRVAGADLQHHAGGVARLAQRRADLVQVLVARHLHRDHAHAILSRELEHVGQALLAVTLERIGTRARLVRSHARAHLAPGFERLEGKLGELARVHGIEARDDVEALLVELDASIGEADRVLVALVAPEDAEFVSSVQSSFPITDAQSPIAGWRSRRAVGYQGLASPANPHRQSGAKGKRIAVGRPRPAARCATAESTATTSSSGAQTAAVSSQSTTCSPGTGTSAKRPSHLSSGPVGSRWRATTVGPAR